MVLQGLYAVVVKVFADCFCIMFRPDINDGAAFTSNLIHDIGMKVFECMISHELFVNNFKVDVCPSCWKFNDTGIGHLQGVEDSLSRFMGGSSSQCNLEIKE